MESFMAKGYIKFYLFIKDRKNSAGNILKRPHCFIFLLIIDIKDGKC